VQKDQAEWVKALSTKEKDDYLLQLLRGEGAYLGMELQRRFRDQQASKRKKDASATEEQPRRSIAELRARAEEMEEVRKQREAER
jgi:hypothetical protein